jgi:two-component system sensor histidine kinase SenX3
VTAVVVAALVGAALAAAVLTVRNRRRQRALHDVLDRYDDLAEDGSADALPRVRRVTGQLSASAVTAEEAVDRLEMTLDRMAEGVVVCDMQGRVVFTNTSGSVLADARHEDALVAAAVADCLRSALRGVASSRSVELVGPPARTMTVDAQLLGRHDGPVGAFATIVDSSHVRRLESMRSDFVANISHELKTPIGGLALLAEALSEVGDPAEQERLAGRLLHEAHRVGRVVDDLLALSAVEADVTDRRERVAVGDVIGRAQAEVAVLSEGHGVEVVTSVVGADLWLEGDPIQLTSALSNLVENAVKYSGGASPVTVTATADDGFVRLVVEDRGIGIPRQHLDRVFERFYRVDRARSQATGGTGLGLALVRNIVRSHGGEVELASREGEGTTVVVRLPVAHRSSAGDPSVVPWAEGPATGGHG